MTTKKIEIEIELRGDGSAALKFNSDEEELSYQEVLTIVKMMTDSATKTLDIFISRNEVVLRNPATKSIPYFKYQGDE